ncbi:MULTISPECIES: hypothetical protein [unclassified Curtobacterium]|uniref:hypothetical protein n=1 Tax=unclassified Curtobacterium TaxID=257496 RepID=UPI000F4BE0EA|nr:MULTISPECIES: hypothetical protein [unclassified Curtobacterium]ROP60288.1 hypothetical protein EDF55_3291 [Curtobacterium sp. ZW137]TCK59599.1 hypothetical protein EDF27_3455 [Curtobacterium sp. PhB136]
MTYDVVLRPRAALVRSTALSIVFSAVPLAVALVWMSFPLRLWALVASVVVVIAIVVGLVFVRLRSAFVGLGPDGVTVRGVVAARRTFSREQVSSIVLATTFGSSVDRTARELVAFDADEHVLFRMRGDVWGDQGLDRVVDALGVQVTEITRPMPARDFARRYLPGRRTH